MNVVEGIGKEKEGEGRKEGSKEMKVPILLISFF